MKKFATFILLLPIVIGAPVIALRAFSAHSVLAFDPQPQAIGEATPVTVHITNPHGARHITAFLEQNGARVTLTESAQPPNRWMFFRDHLPTQDFHFTAGKASDPSLKEGSARVGVDVESNDFRASTDTITADVKVILRPPTVTGDGFEHIIHQGGSEFAIFTALGYWSDAGVRVGRDTFRSFPSPGNPNQRMALFAYAWDTPRGTVPVVFVKNPAGTEATARFRFKVFPEKARARNFAIDDRFLEKVVNQIEPGGSGDLLQRFLKINGEMRRANNQTLADLRLKTDDKFLWTQPFVQLANSKVESGFADVRSYIYKGKKVDQQVHLGFDLAVAQHTPVAAANDGKVVWAAPLGIYGNCIVVDHGLALQSIYGHLSEIGVKEGQLVKRGEIIGKSGSTGLAGGDHLHFSMQIDGVQVNPLEWWDGHWIQDRVLGRLAPQ
jgi:hypothetical protein